MTGDGARGRSFGAYAGAYDRARPEYPLEAARWLVGDAPGRVVELGAGTGKLTRALAALGLDVRAVEPDERMLAVLAAKGLPQVEVVVGAAEELPFADSSVDTVVAGSSFHWFDLEPTLAEVHRVLRPGGRLAFAWNRRDDTDPLVARITAAIRGADGGAWRGRRPWLELVPAGGLFGPVEHERFEHVLTLPRALLAEHLLSYSRVGLLPAEEQQELTERVEGLLGDEADPLRLPFVVDAYRTSRL